MERKTRTLNQQPCLPYNDLACLTECPLYIDDVRREMREDFAQAGGTDYTYGAVERTNEIVAANIAFKTSEKVLAQCLLYKPDEA